MSVRAWAFYGGGGGKYQEANEKAERLGVEAFLLSYAKKSTEGAKEARRKTGDAWALMVILSDFDGIYRRALHHDAWRKKCVLQKPINLSSNFATLWVFAVQTFPGP